MILLIDIGTVSCCCSLSIRDIIFTMLNTTNIIIACQRPGRVLDKTGVSNYNFIWINFQEWWTECVDLRLVRMVVDKDPLRIPVHFEYLLGLWSDPFDRVEEVVHAVFCVVQQDLGHLLLGYEPAEVPNPIVSQVLSAVIPHNFPHVLSLLSLLVPKLNNFFLFLISREDWPWERRVHEVRNCCWLQFLGKPFSGLARNWIHTTWNNGRIGRSLISLLQGLVVILRRWLRFYFFNVDSLGDFARALLITDLSWSTHVTQLLVNFLPHGLRSVTSIISFECLNIRKL